MARLLSHGFTVRPATAAFAALRMATLTRRPSVSPAASPSPSPVTSTFDTISTEGSNSRISCTNARSSPLQCSVTWASRDPPITFCARAGFQRLLHVVAQGVDTLPAFHERFIPDSPPFGHIIEKDGPGIVVFTVGQIGPDFFRGIGEDGGDQPGQGMQDAVDDGLSGTAGDAVPPFPHTAGP